jgi:hypothetical protein
MNSGFCLPYVTIDASQASAGCKPLAFSRDLTEKTQASPDRKRNLSQRNPKLYHDLTFSATGKISFLLAREPEARQKPSDEDFKPLVGGSVARPTPLTWKSRGFWAEKGKRQLCLPTETLHRRSILFAKRAKRRAAYLRGRTESFMAFPTRNFSVVFAGI